MVSDTIMHVTLKTLNGVVMCYVFWLGCGVGGAVNFAWHHKKLVEICTSLLHEI